MSSASSLIFLVGIFASTNIDDLFILIGFFSDKSISHRQIIVGQIVGIGALIALSLAFALAALAILPAYVGLLGIGPILLGLIKLRRAVEHLNRSYVPSQAQSNRGIGALGVAAVTVASGGDNIGIYAPLLSTQTRVQMVQTILVFGSLTVVWCFAARLLGTHPAVAQRVNRIGPIFLPLALIVLGAWILHSSGALELLTRFVPAGPVVR
jgi:cadmium resistance protein CadD (predicted permease)